MIQRTRREFIKDVSAGVVAASVGSGLAFDLGFSTSFADEGAERLTFGSLEPLVRVMQETPAERLLAVAVERLRQGTALREVVAAAALANARTFGGEDYVGFHTMMALAPAFHMAGELPGERRALPVLKVLFRNATRIQEYGGSRREVLHPVAAGALPADRPGSRALCDAVHRGNVADAERTYAALARNNADDALNTVLDIVQEAAEVHRVVLPYRAWDLMSIIGRDQAHALLRQSVRYCVKQETQPYTQHLGSVRTLVPRLLDQYRLVGRRRGRAWPRTAGSRNSLRPFSAARRSAPPTPRQPPSPKAWSRRPWPRPFPLPPINWSCATMADRKPPAQTSPPAVSTAIPSACTPATRPMPGGTWPAPPTPATRWCA